MKKSILALVMVAAFSVQANAGTVTADHYTITYDDTFWGIATQSWSHKSETLKFSFSELGIAAKGIDGAVVDNNAQLFSWNSPLLTISANNGYKIASVTTEGIGRVKTIGAAYAQNSLGGYWGFSSGSAEEFFTHVSSDSNQGKYLLQNTTYFNSNFGGEFPPVAVESFSKLATNLVGADIQVATLSGFYSFLNAIAYEKGSSSKVSLSAVTFSVDVIPVPEPESYAMFLAGLGIIGAVTRRRSRKA